MQVTDRTNDRSAISITSLPQEVLEYELFPRLNLPSFYALCATCRTIHGLQHNIDRWRPILKRWGHNKIQELVRTSAYDCWYGAPAFICMLIGHQKDLEIVVDDRISLFVYCRTLERTEINYKSRQIESERAAYIYRHSHRKMDGYDLKIPFCLLFAKLNELAMVLLKIREMAIQGVDLNYQGKGTIDQYLFQQFFLYTVNLWKEIQSSGVSGVYLADYLIRRMDYEIFWLFSFTYPITDAIFTNEEDRFSIWRLFYQVIGYLLNHGKNNPKQLTQLLKNHINRHNALYWMPTIISTISDEIFKELDGQFVLTYSAGCYYYDSSIWKKVYSKCFENVPLVVREHSNISEGIQLLYGAFTAISPLEWYNYLHSFSGQDRQLIITKTLAGALECGYNHWHEEASRLVSQKEQ